jgi:hypothetical protein
MGNRPTGDVRDDYEAVNRMKGITEIQRSCLIELVLANHRADIVRADAYFAARNPEIARMHARTMAMNAELRQSLAQTFALEQPSEAAWIPMGWFLQWAGVTYSLGAVPGTRVQAGDVLQQQPESGFHSIALSVIELEVLRSGSEPFVNASGSGSGSAVTAALEILRDRRRWRRRPNGTFRPALFIVRPVEPEQVWLSVQAPSVDAAIFDLLGSVGGRMPSQGES